MGKYGKISFQLKTLGLSPDDYEDSPITRAEVDYEIIGGLRRLKGWIDFINSVEPERAAIFYKQYGALKD